MVLALVDVCLVVRAYFSCYLAIVVECAHVTEVEAEPLRGIYADAGANHVVREVEREVVHEFIIHAVTRGFPRTGNGDELADVPFSTQDELVRVVADEVLAIHVLCADLVEELVVGGIEAYILNRRVLRTESKKCRNVLANMSAVLELAEDGSGLCSDFRWEH